MAQWNPWHGCRKISAGCQNCYVYRIDATFDRDASAITKLQINLSRWLGPSIEGVIAGGESGNEARICNYDWVFDIRNQCSEKKVPFHFKQTGARFVKDGRLYNIKRQDQHLQAAKAGIDFVY